MSKEYYPLYISDDLFIPVDAEGYAARASEGSLGCVIEIRELGNPKARWALKVPRLLADTARENAYINKLMEDEHSVVKSVLGVPGARNGLLDAQVIQQGFLKVPVRSENSVDPEAAASSNQLVLLRFEKGRPPRLCGVRIGADEKLEFKPTSRIQRELEKFISPEDVDKLRKSGTRARTRVLPKKANIKQNTEHDLTAVDDDPGYALSDSLREKHGVDCWYVFAPSVLYRWATTSLHQALEDGLKWSAEEHLLLAQQVLAGLVGLHSRGIIHADIRPANLMSEGDWREPVNYRLIDYGSFGIERSLPGLESVWNGNTNAENAVLGPSALPQRASPFYAPERRPGGENESADIAIVYSTGKFAAGNVREDEHRYLVCYGWRSKLLDEKGEPHKEITKAIENAWRAENQDQQKSTTAGNPSNTPEKSDDAVPSDSSPKGDGAKTAVHAMGSHTENGEDERRKEDSLRQDRERTLQRGDRIRIRDFLFDIEKVLNAGNGVGRLFVCQRPYWRVYHDRIVVRDTLTYLKQRPQEDELPDAINVLAIPRIVELLQVSTASDLYGVGSVLLYGLFRQSYVPVAGDIWGGPDRLFSMLMGTIETSRYFQNVGTQLELCRRILYQEARTDAPRHDWAKQRTDSGQSIMSFVQGVAHTTIAITPGMEFIYQGCDRNDAIFVLILHFALSCIHRQTVLTKAQREEIFQPSNLDARKGTSEGSSWDANRYVPFSISRTEAGEDRASKKAAERLRELLRVLGRDLFKAFQATDSSRVESGMIYMTDFEARAELVSKREAIKRTENLCGGSWPLVAKSKIKDALISPDQKTVSGALPATEAEKSD